MAFKILFLILIFNIYVGILLADPIVTIANGDVMGTELQSVGNRMYFAFRGIPFGKSTEGNLRFQPPVPVDNWSGVFKATQDRPVCPQILSGKVVVGSEDCLFVYVYTPQLPSNDSQLLPVMTFFHGGGFASGSPQFSYFRPDRFMDHNVVLVLPAYRLGPLGFLSTDDEVSMGNYGLLDQLLALQWVQKNIAAFGGDKDKVTIFGENAGAASVFYHMVSEASAGLFRGVIGQSGTVTCPWAYQEQPRLRADQLAMTIDCPHDNSSILVDCLKQKSAKDIMVAFSNMDQINSRIELLFVPCKEDPDDGRFLKQHPKITLAEGIFNRVPTIAGVNEDNGDITYSMSKRYYTTIDDTFYDKILPHLLQNLTKYDANLVNISYAVKEEYFDKIDINNQSQVIRTAIDLNSDIAFKSPMDYTIRALANYNVPVYMYTFDYAGSCNPYNFSGEPEVSDGDELCYLFSSNITKFTPDDQFISDQLLSMWVNFATHLNPTPSGDFKWTPTPLLAARASLEYLKIVVSNLTMEEGFLNERMNFWEKTVPNIVQGAGINFDL